MTLAHVDRQSGFTLLEIMVVIVILGLLVAVVAPNVLQNQDKAMVEKARADASRRKYRSIGVSNRNKPQLSAAGTGTWHVFCPVRKSAKM